MNQDSLSLISVWGILRRNWWGAALCIIAFVMASYILAKALPKKYKSKATLSIQTSYFQNPLVNSVISDINDPSELRAQRVSLIQLAISDNFIDELGEKFDVYRAAPKDRLRLIEREQLRSEIQYLALSSNSFLITSIGASPDVAFKINKLVVQRIIDTLIDERLNNLNKTRSALTDHLKALSSIIQNSNPVSTQNPERISNLEQELAKIQGQIGRASKQFTEQHPEMQKLRRNAAGVKAQLEKMTAKENKVITLPATSDSDSALALASARKPIAEVHDDLVKKLSNLEIVMNIERDRNNLSYVNVVEQPSLPVIPYLPNQKMFIGVGTLLGFLFSVVLILFLETQRGTFGGIDDVQPLLGIPIVGSLPPSPVPGRALLSNTAGRTNEMPVRSDSREELGDRLVWLSERGVE